MCCSAENMHMSFLRRTKKTRQTQMQKGRNLIEEFAYVNEETGGIILRRETGGS